MPFNYEALAKERRDRLVALCKELMRDYKAKAFRRITNNARLGKLEYDEYYPWKSRHIIEQIDDVLAEHYGFTPEEVNFLKTCDIPEEISEALARRAALLRRRARQGSAIDALVVAFAEPDGTVLTSDPAGLAAPAQYSHGVRVERV
jgi:hypothetical protein